MYSYNEEEETNPNGWGPEYYDQDAWNEQYELEITNGNWELPDTPEEKDIDELWGIWTPAYYYSGQELLQLYRNITVTKQIIAGQPIKRGKWQCNDACDIENHHLHTYCTMCKRQIPTGCIVLQHGCVFGFQLGQVRPDMNPDYLINDVFWTEPEILDESDDESVDSLPPHLRDIRRIRAINTRWEQHGGFNTEQPTASHFSSYGRRFSHQ
jgi:hypothetical protein